MGLFVTFPKELGKNLLIDFYRLYLPSWVLTSETSQDLFYLFLLTFQK